MTISTPKEVFAQQETKPLNFWQNRKLRNWRKQCIAMINENIDLLKTRDGIARCTWPQNTWNPDRSEEEVINKIIAELENSGWIGVFGRTLRCDAGCYFQISMDQGEVGCPIAHPREFVGIGELPEQGEIVTGVVARRPKPDQDNPLFKVVLPRWQNVEVYLRSEDVIPRSERPNQQFDNMGPGTPICAVVKDVCVTKFRANISKVLGDQYWVPVWDYTNIFISECLLNDVKYSDKIQRCA